MILLKKKLEILSKNLKLEKNKMWPDTYPTVLRKVSYNFNENIGIFNNWNKYCNTCKENPYFVFYVLKDKIYHEYFFDTQTIPVEVYELIKYISSCLSVKWTDDEFIIKLKTKEEDGKFKPIFKEEDFYALTKKVMMKKKDANKFLKWCIEYLKKFYNNIVMKFNENKNN